MMQAASCSRSLVAAGNIFFSCFPPAFIHAFSPLFSSCSFYQIIKFCVTHINSVMPDVGGGGGEKNKEEKRNEFWNAMFA